MRAAERRAARRLRRLAGQAPATPAAYRRLQLEELRIEQALARSLQPTEIDWLNADGAVIRRQPIHGHPTSTMQVLIPQTTTTTGG